MDHHKFRLRVCLAQQSSPKDANLRPPPKLEKSPTSRIPPASRKFNQHFKLTLVDNRENHHPQAEKRRKNSSMREEQLLTHGMNESEL